MLMSIDFNENAVEFLENDKFMFVTFSQKKFINRVKTLAEKHPDKVKIYEERTDSIYAKMPVSWLRIQPTARMSEETKAKAKENITKARQHRRAPM